LVTEFIIPLVHLKLNMFRALRRSSSGAPTVFAASGIHTAIR